MLGSKLGFYFDSRLEALSPLVAGRMTPRRSRGWRRSLTSGTGRCSCIVENAEGAGSNPEREVHPRRSARLEQKARVNHSVARPARLGSDFRPVGYTEEAYPSLPVAGSEDNGGDSPNRRVRPLEGATHVSEVRTRTLQVHKQTNKC